VIRAQGVDRDQDDAANFRRAGGAGLAGVSTAEEGGGGADGGGGGGADDGGDWGASTMVKLEVEGSSDREAQVWVKRADGVAEAIKVELVLPRDIHPEDYKIGFSFGSGKFEECVPKAVIGFTVLGDHEGSSGSHESNAEYLDDDDDDDEADDPFDFSMM